MALKPLLSTLLLAIVAAGCNRAAAPEAAPEEPEALSVTRWTAKTELFAEYSPLVVGSTSRFAIHLTRMDGFKALTDGNVEVRSKAAQRNQKCSASTRRLGQASSGWT